MHRLSSCFNGINTVETLADKNTNVCFVCRSAGWDLCVRVRARVRCKNYNLAALLIVYGRRECLQLAPAIYFSESD